LTNRIDRSSWNTTQKRETKLIRQLAQREKSFTELLIALGWGSQTLTVYLKTLESRGCIASKKHGRNVTYCLVKSNPYVGKMLSLSAPLVHDLRVFNRVELGKLNEEALVSDWLNSIKFVFLNLLRDYTLLGKKDMKVETHEILRRILQVEIEDLTDTVDAYGQVLTQRIQEGTIKPGKIQKIHLRMEKEMGKELLKRHNKP
jgi:hypothetical protein